jgi:hypothetical protein
MDEDQQWEVAKGVFGIPRNTPLCHQSKPWLKTNQIC